MKKAKRFLSVLLCIVLLGTVSLPAFAISADDYKNIPYKCYTYIGDSIAWGFGLDRSHDPASPEYVCSREIGAYGDLVGKVIEEKNGGVTHAAATSGARLSDYRSLIEVGMGKTDPYVFSDWYAENRAPERSGRLSEMAPEICSWLRESDLISLQLGYNDLLAAPMFTLQDSPMMAEMMELLDDPNAGTAELSAGLKSFMDKFIEVMLNGLSSFLVNTRALVKDINELTGRKADVVLVGYYNPYRTLKQSADSDFSPMLDAMTLAISTMNDYYSEIADQYDNVYYVDAPDVSVFFPDGMLYSEATSDGEYKLYGAHPDEEGHEYIAKNILKVLDKLNTCPLFSHDTLFDSVFLFPDNLLKTFAKLVTIRTNQFFASIFSAIFRY